MKVSTLKASWHYLSIISCIQHIICLERYDQICSFLLMYRKYVLYFCEQWRIIISMQRTGCSGKYDITGILCLLRLLFVRYVIRWNRVWRLSISSKYEKNLRQFTILQNCPNGIKTLCLETIDHTWWGKVVEILLYLYCVLVMSTVLIVNFVL